MSKVQILYGPDEGGNIIPLDAFTQYAHVVAQGDYSVQTKEMGDLTEAELSVVSDYLREELKPISASPSAILDAFDAIGQFDLISAALGANRRAEMKFNAASSIPEDHPMVQGIAGGAGWTDAEIRALFVKAREIDARA